MRFAPGTSSLRSDIRFAASAPVMFETPVASPPGRARLGTKPLPTGSPTMVKTIGMSLVAWIAARAPGVLIATMTSGRASARSLASAGSRSCFISADRTRSRRFLPS